ncbi:MAG: hypothetical protein V3575_05390, partial [Candidatus Absconditabacteria bacterium]
ISEKEFNLQPKEKVNFSFRLDCKELFSKKNNIEYNFRIYLPGDLSLYNRKIPFNVTKDKCSAIEIEKLTIDQYGSYEGKTLTVPIGMPITIKALINNIGGLDLYNTILDIEFEDSESNNYLENKNIISYNGAPSNNIRVIVDEIQVNKNKEVSITFTPTLAGIYKLNGKFKSENIIGLDLQFDYDIIAYQNGIEFTDELITSKNSDKGAAVINYNLTNENIESEYKLYVYGTDLSSLDFDWYILNEKSVIRKGEQVYFKKLISNYYYEQILKSEEDLKIQIIIYDNKKDAYIDIIPIGDISKKRTIKIN